VLKRQCDREAEARRAAQAEDDEHQEDDADRAAVQDGS
jgi:hypothetical protein